MSREEELIRSTTRAIASAVREVPPLRLEAAADELRSPASARRSSRRRRTDASLAVLARAGHRRHGCRGHRRRAGARPGYHERWRDLPQPDQLSRPRRRAPVLRGTHPVRRERPPRHRAGRNRGGRLGHRRADSQVRAPGAYDLPERERGRRRPHVRRLRRDVLYRVIPPDKGHHADRQLVRGAPGPRHCQPGPADQAAHQAVVVGRQGGGVQRPGARADLGDGVVAVRPGTSRSRYPRGRRGDRRTGRK